MDFDFQSFISFYNFCEKLKTQTRHCFTSDIKRRESVAEHTWMVCMLAIYFHKHVDQKLDLLKILKMIIIHDLAEAITGDIPAFEKSDRKDNKYDNELKAITKIFAEIKDEDLRKDLTDLWFEYEERQSEISKFVKAIDKIDDVMQHNVSDISTWDQNDFDVLLGGCDKNFEYDNFMKDLIQMINNLTIEKVEKAGMRKRLKDNRTIS